MQLLDLQKINSLNLHSTVVRRKEIIFRIEQSDESVILEFQGKKVIFPAYVNEALSFLTQAEHFQTNDIPDVLDNAGKLVLVKRLVREGFLSLTESYAGRNA